MDSKKEGRRMRTVIIKVCEYGIFEIHRDQCLMFKPFGLISAIYSTKLKMAMFQFWDTDYIPDNMQQFIVRPK